MLTPSLQFNNESGTCVFLAQDLEPKWRQTPRPLGSYTAVAWIPGNLLADGALLVTVSIGTQRPLQLHAHRREAVAFRIMDAFDGNSARGEWDGQLPGIVRPLLEWKTEWSAPTDAFAKGLSAERPSEPS